MKDDCHIRMSVKLHVLLILMELTCITYEGGSKSFRTGRLERELQLLHLSANGCSCMVIL